MKIKRISLVLLIAVLSLTMMACPSVVNSGPEFVQIVDGEVTSVNSIEYYYLKGTDFDPGDMLDSIINDQNIIAIDYDQSGIIWGKNRDYIDISNQIVNTTFYSYWDEGEDANGDGVVDELDDEFFGQVKTDNNGDPIYNMLRINMVKSNSTAEGDNEFPFTLKVTDDEGAETQITGIVYTVSSLPG